MMRSHRIRYPRRLIASLYYVAGMTETEAIDFIEFHRQGFSGEGDVDLLNRAASAKFRAKVRMKLPRIVADDLWLCNDCVTADINGDYMGLDKEREDEVRNGLQRLASRYGGRLVPDFDPNLNDGIHEFSWRMCDSCGTRLGGYRARFAIIS